jgi:hypothetical protein
MQRAKTTKKRSAALIDGRGQADCGHEGEETALASIQSLRTIESRDTSAKPLADSQVVIAATCPQSSPSTPRMRHPAVLTRCGVVGGSGARGEEGEDEARGEGGTRLFLLQCTRERERESR